MNAPFWQKVITGTRWNKRRKKTEKNILTENDPHENKQPIYFYIFLISRYILWYNEQSILGLYCISGFLHNYVQKVGR